MAAATKKCQYSNTLNLYNFFYSSGVSQKLFGDDSVGVSPRKNRCNELESPKAEIKSKETDTLILSPKSSLKTPVKVSPSDVKKALGTPKSLATLQARLKSLSGSTTPKAKKALFLEDEKVSKSTPESPKLTKRGLDFEIATPTKKAIIPTSPVKASPRKQVLLGMVSCIK